MVWNTRVTAADLRRDAAQTPAALTVTEAVMRAKGSLEQLVLVVEGEVSQFKDSPAYKGVYFPLSDGSSVIDCMMWRNRYRESQVELRPGARVRLSGRFTVYPAKGRLQFEVFKLELAGEGDLRARVAQLARRLQAEGLMDPARKRPIPAFCRRVVVITSPHGKVKDDVARTLRRRNPVVELQYCAVNVEGATAAAQMIEALRVGASARPDAILLVRGGGSYEDLMPFNDEGLARAVAACPVPVVTGIGHEPDTTLCDMVSDRRSSTPTAAAESVAPAAADLLADLDVRRSRMTTALRRSLADRSAALAALSARPVLARPCEALFASRSMQLDMASDRLAAAIPAALEASRARLAASAQLLRASGAHFGRAQRQRLQVASTRLRADGDAVLSGPRSSLGVQAGRLDALSPLAVIARGYSMATDDDGRVVSSVVGLEGGDSLHVRLRDGVADCDVRSVRRLLDDGPR